MRTVITSVLAFILVGTLGGCQMVDDVLNPRPQSGHTRVSQQLDEFPPLPRDQRRPVTVYQFENKTGFPHGLQMSNGMTEMLISALVRTGQFRVVERAALDQLMTERDLQRSGEAEGEAATTPMIGAAFIVTGAVTELSERGSGGVQIDRTVGVGVQMVTAEVALDMRIVDAATSEIIASIPIRKTLRRTGLSASHSDWGVSGDVEISNALDRAVRETIEEAVYRILQERGVRY